tara:strand:- start:313 stop:474 length:162 start_codon:yes stop_codon:yes gene_type:complete
MKRLLLAPLLIALAGCSLPFDKSKKDVVVKTDLNETYIVKDFSYIGEVANNTT